LQTRSTGVHAVRAEPWEAPCRMPLRAAAAAGRAARCGSLRTACARALLTLLVAAGLAGALRAQAATTAPDLSGLQAAHPFVENRGQWPEGVHFAARGTGWRAAIEERGWRLALAAGEGEACVVRMRAGSGPAIAPAGLEAGNPSQHFFRAGAPGVRAGAARSFARLRYEEIAAGIDLVLRCENGRLVYDIELDAGATLESLVFEVEGATLAELAADGSLALLTPLGPLVQSPPRAFEFDADGGVHPCESRFVRLDATRFGLAVPKRRPGARLLVDPALVWSTYIGGGTTQSVRAIADDGAGGALIAGTTESFDFPTTAGVFDPNHNGASDAFVTALDAQGQIRWCSFLGGLGLDEASSVAVDAAGIVTLAGTTRSADFPATAGAFDTSLGGSADGFVARLSSSGAALLWCTYLGGSQHEVLNALAVDASGEAVVGGWTSSFNYPVTPGSFGQQHSFGLGSDGCLTRLAADGSALVWSTYLGGAQDDIIEDLALDPGGVLVGGSSASGDFPYTIGGALGGEDGFLAFFAPGAVQLLMASAHGGFGADCIYGVASDGAGGGFGAGRTDSPGLAVTPGVFGPAPAGLEDGFLARVDATGALQACSYLGGTNSERILGMARSASGEFFVCGWTDSADFPTTPGAFDRKLNLSPGSIAGDAFVASVAPDLSRLIYSSYFGAGDEERAHAIAAVDADTVLLAGETVSYFFPTTPGAHRTARGILATLEGFASSLDLLQHPIGFGLGKLSSYGAHPELSWLGFPSVQDQNFQLVLHSAIPDQPAVLFVGQQSWNQPFLGGTLYVKPPLKRAAALVLDFVGYAEAPYALSPAMIGTSFYAQAWFKDPWDSLGCGLSSGLEVLIHP